MNTTFVEGAARNRALAVWGGAGAAGLVIGVLLGGFLTQLLGWEAIFFVNVPLATAAAVLALWLVPADGARVLVANADTEGLHGEALRRATADGLSRAVYVIAAAIAATALVAFTLRREIGRISEAPCPRQIALPLKAAER